MKYIIFKNNEQGILLWIDLGNKLNVELRIPYAARVWTNKVHVCMLRGRREKQPMALSISYLAFRGIVIEKWCSLLKNDATVGIRKEEEKKQIGEAIYIQQGITYPLAPSDPEIISWHGPYPWVIEAEKESLVAIRIVNVGSCSPSATIAEENEAVDWR